MRIAAWIVGAVVLLFLIVWALGVLLRYERKRSALREPLPTTRRRSDIVWTDEQGIEHPGKQPRPVVFDDGSRGPTDEEKKAKQ